MTVSAAMNDAVEKVLITGGRGFIGARLAEHLSERFAVTRIVRDRPDAGDWCYDLSRSLPPEEELSQFGCIVHLAGWAHSAEPASEAARQAVFTINTEATIELARRASRAGVQRFVFVSSSKVLGDISAEPLKEHVPFDGSGAYASSKIAAEQALAALDGDVAMTICIVRPPLVYGPGVEANFAALLGLAASPWPLPLRAAVAPRSFVYIDNLVAFLSLLVQQGQGVYHVTDSHSVSVAQLLHDLRQLQKRPPRLVRVPQKLMRSLARLAGREEMAARLFDPMELSDARAREELGWAPPVAFEQALKETLAWYRSKNS